MHDLKKSSLHLPSESYLHTYFNLGKHLRLHVCSFHQHQTIAVFFWLRIKINEGFLTHEWKTILHHSVLLKKTMSLEVSQKIVLAALTDTVRTERVWCYPVAYEIVHMTPFKQASVNIFDLELSLGDGVAEVRDCLECFRNNKSIVSNKMKTLHSFKLQKQSFAAIKSTDQWPTSYLRDVINQYEEKQKSYGLCYVVVKYPSSFLSSVISIRKQEQLEKLGARDFNNAVLHSLTNEERESLMCQEKQRLRTFESGWPHEGYLPGAVMAKAGFFYLNDSDKVQCTFCRGALHNWKPGDRPAEEHLQRFRNCKLARGLPCGNIPYYPYGEPMTEEFLTNIKLTDSKLLENPNAAVELGINKQRASKPEYAAESSRIRTFGRFPPTCPVPAEKICRAGFYYTGFDDTVKCFWCEGRLEKWERCDDPWHEHEKNFPACHFMQASKETGKCYYNDAVGGETAQSQPGSSQSAHVCHTNYEGMIRDCEDLGYDRADINKVIRKNRRNPFSTTREMLAALHALEDKPSTSLPLPATNTDTALPTEQIRCKSCRRNKCSHIGLPCGCLILCSDCANQNTLHLLCPTCDSNLNGLMRVYFG